MAFQRMSSQTMKRTLGLDVALAQGEGKVADSRTTERRINLMGQDQGNGFGDCQGTEAARWICFKATIVMVIHEVLILRY
jgi:hypothetical protein